MFKATAADGIDVYFDNTGGDILGADALRRMKTQRPHRVLRGRVGQYDTSDPAPGPRGIPSCCINSRVRMEGFLVFDYADRYDEARRDMSQWVADGSLKPKVTEFHGLEEAPQAFVELLAGRTVGTTVVTI